MLIDIICDCPDRALQYCERFVNDGSPSGFTEESRTSLHTDPYSLTPHFQLYCISPETERLEIYGTIPDCLPFEEGIGQSWFLLHPDMAEHSDLAGLGATRLESLRVIPTSSCRTVQIMDDASGDYIKLHYDGIIGRINRSLPRSKAISGPEVSKEISSKMFSESFPAALGILRETGAKILHVEEASKTWGMVWREGRPFGRCAKHVTFLLPLFALFSVDRLRPYDSSLLKQLSLIWGSSGEEMVLELILLQLVDCYFSLVAYLGLQLELNAQNILIGFDSDWRPVMIVLRDLMGTEKDLTIREGNALSTDFDSAPYKCISHSEDPQLYKIRHSFVFDFKVSCYVLQPVLKEAIATGLCSSDAIDIIKERVVAWQGRLPEGYFPSGDIWYKHDRILLTESRPYVEVAKPMFR